MQPTLTSLSSFTALLFSGAKVQEFLQGQLTCDMRELSAHGNYSLAACCDHRGRMVANFWVVRWHDNYLFILPKEMASIVQTHLQKYAVFSKVTVSQDERFFIAALTHELLKEHFSNSVCIQLPNKNRYLIISEKNDFQNYKINSDENEWKKNNIADRLCILYPKTSLLFTPQMISLDKLGGVSFKKGCYVGQEIVARTEYLGTLKRHLHRRTIHADHAVFPGDELKNEEAEVIGVVVESVKINENEYDILAVIQDRVSPPLKKGD